MDVKAEIKKVEDEFNVLDAKKAEYQQGIVAIEDRQKQLQGRYALLKEMEAETELKEEAPAEVVEETKKKE